MQLLVAAIAAVYGAGVLFSPFPLWRSYCRLWLNVFSCRGSAASIPLGTRWRQARFLSIYLLSAPLITALWWLDELLYPGYRRKKVRPVFILGQPRSGTTLLHRTLATDEENFVAVRHIEWRLPFISVQKLLQWFPLAQRALQRSYWPSTPAGELASRMHPNKLGDWEEDGIFFEECFLSHFFLFLRFPCPDQLDHFDNFERLPRIARRRMLETHRRVIQKVLYLREEDGRRGRRYLSKEVTSHSKFPEILDLYGDADFVFSLRSADGFMSSLLALVRYSTMSKTGIDPMGLSGWQDAVVSRMQRDVKTLLQIIGKHADPEKSILLTYEDVKGDLAGSVRRIYDLLQLAPNADAARRLEEASGAQATRDRAYNYESCSFPGFEGYNGFVSRLRKGP